MSEPEESKDELLKEVKELKKKIEDESTEQQKARTISNARWAVIGLMMMGLAFVLWRCAVGIGIGEEIVLEDLENHALIINLAIGIGFVALLLFLIKGIKKQ